MAPGAVPFIISSAGSSTSIAVYWVEAERASSYLVERKTGLQPWAVVATVPMLENYYLDSGVVPGTAYSYRVRAANAGGTGPYSSVTTSLTWSQEAQWVYDNYGSPDALNHGDMTNRGPDGTMPLMRFAFNLTADEPWRCVEPGGSSGYPRIWLDPAGGRLFVEFARRIASMNPGVVYQVEFASDLSHWSSAPSPASITPVDSIWERVRYEDTLSCSNATARFCRISVGQ